MAQPLDMHGKTVLITGATNGIGKVTALELAKMSATVVLVGRSRSRTEAVASEIKSASKNNAVDLLIGDLSSMAEVRRIADEFQRKYQRLDVLVNNAGAYFTSRQETVDGYEMTFGLNHLNYFLLTNLLLDTLKSSVPSRIVNVASDAHTNGVINFDDLQLKKSYGMAGITAYSQSKLANVLFTYELAKRLAGTGVTANAIHPGFVASGFAHNNGTAISVLMKIIGRLFALTPEQGAETIIYLASSPEVEGVTGKYFEKCQAVQSAPQSYDEAAARRLWEISETMVNQQSAVV